MHCLAGDRVCVQALARARRSVLLKNVVWPAVLRSGPCPSRSAAKLGSAIVAVVNGPHGASNLFCDRRRLARAPSNGG